MHFFLDVWLRVYVVEFGVQGVGLRDLGVGFGV